MSFYFCRSHSSGLCSPVVAPSVPGDYRSQLIRILWGTQGHGGWAVAKDAFSLPAMPAFPLDNHCSCLSDVGFGWCRCSRGSRGSSPSRTDSLWASHASDRKDGWAQGWAVRGTETCWECGARLFPTTLGPKEMTQGSSHKPFLPPRGGSRQRGKGLRNSHREKPDLDGITPPPDPAVPEVSLYPWPPLWLPAVPTNSPFMLSA